MYITVQLRYYIHNKCCVGEQSRTLIGYIFCNYSNENMFNVFKYKFVKLWVGGSVRYIYSYYLYYILMTESKTSIIDQKSVHMYKSFNHTRTHLEKQSICDKPCLNDIYTT